MQSRALRLVLLPLTALPIATLLLLALPLGAGAAALAAPGGCPPGTKPCIKHKGRCCGPPSPPPPKPPPPADWAARVASNRMLYTHDDAVDVPHVHAGGGTTTWGWHPSIANGVVGTIVDSGTVFLSGVFNGPDLSTTRAYAANFSNAGARPHLAMVPSHLAVRIANASVFACAIDLERGIYLRRSRLASAVVEQRWYAHRTRKSVLVMELELLGAAGAEAAAVATVGLQLHSIGDFMTNIDVAWTEVDESTGSKMWQRAGHTKQNEDGSVPGTLRLAYVSSAVPASLELTAGSPVSFFGVGESSITARGQSSPLQRAVATWNALDSMAAGDKAGLAKGHAEAWAELWHLATIEIDTDRVDIQRAVNSTLYGMLSLHDESDTSPFPGSPLDGITLGSFGHWGGCYLWDADLWMYPVLALWRPDFMSKMLQCKTRHFLSI